MVEVCPLSDFFGAARVISFDGCMIAQKNQIVIKPVVEFSCILCMELSTKKPKRLSDQHLKAL